MSVLLFVISALRAIIEMLGLALLGMGFLALLTGSQRASNPIYQLLELITRAPRRGIAAILPASASPRLVGVSCFVVLLLLWLALAWWRLAIR